MKRPFSDALANEVIERQVKRITELEDKVIPAFKAELVDVKRERDKAVAYATKIERGEAVFAKEVDAQMLRIAALPLDKSAHESLAAAVARVLMERDSLRTALAAAQADSARYSTKEEIWRRCAMFHDDILAAERECAAIDSAMKPTP